MSRFVMHFGTALAGSLAVAYAIANNIQQFYCITGIALFSTLLMSIAGVCVYELAKKRAGGRA